MQLFCKQPHGGSIPSAGPCNRKVTWEEQQSSTTMNAYIRFETSCRCAHSGRRLGVFRSAGRLEHREDLSDWTADQLEESLAWFNQNLIVPRRRLVERRGVFWFRSDAHQIVGRMWDLVAILRNEGVFMEVRRTSTPGMIVYEDEQQVAAIPHRRRVRRRALRLVRTS
jgi:hypothetical protein